MHVFVGILLALLGSGRPGRPPARGAGEPKGHPEPLVATWFEEGAHAELRLTLRADGRATKQLRRQCIERSDQECIPLRYDGTWDADAHQLVVHLPGGMDE